MREEKTLVLSSRHNNLPLRKGENTQRQFVMDACPKLPLGPGGGNIVSPSWRVTQHSFTASHYELFSKLVLGNDAEGGSRTPMTLRSLAPEASASTSSATSASAERFSITNHLPDVSILLQCERWYNRIR